MYIICEIKIIVNEHNPLFKCEFKSWKELAIHCLKVHKMKYRVEKTIGGNKNG